MDNLQEAYLSVYEQEKGRGPRISDTYDMRDAEGGPKGGGTIKGPRKKNVIRINKEEVENWVNSLIEEGYDLSDYTWDEMCEFYLDEATKAETHKEKEDPSFSRRIARNDRYRQENPNAGINAQLFRQKAHASKRRVKKEEFDLFDYILEYLIAEGYADTNENAIAIMASMSEDWKEEILDEGRIDWRKGKLSGSGRSPEHTAGDRAFKNLADATTTRQTQAVRGPRGRQAIRAKNAYAAIEKTTKDYNSGKHS
jgi:hypothetical protein